MNDRNIKFINYKGKKLKVIKHDGWTETIWPSGFVMREGNYPEYMEHEFYARCTPRASRLRHRGSPETLIALAQKEETGGAS
jgi:hypothetical protein